ncbi:hypothetical protein E4U55_007891 [Claviceps digitariae]|nr:hypothetical protein E4U55_007891 [Claviceps digitariae]
MPLINGQKMACEPCIRGHRSTKCTHANERLMVPVRKPGRPLSSCPHPSSRPCACAAVTAAIPRKQKCRCGTSDTPAVEKQPDHDSSPPKVVTPPSPSKVGHAGFRVNKQSAKSGSSRKQSVDLAGLHRMDSSQINIVPPYSAMSPPLSSTNGSSTPMSDMSLYGSIAMRPGDRSHSADSSVYPMFPSYAPGPNRESIGQTKPPMTMNGQIIGLTDPAAKSEPETPRSCCGGGIDGVKSQERTMSVHVDASDVGGSSSNKNNTNVDNSSSTSSSSVEPTAARGCCSSGAFASTDREKKDTLRGMPPPLGMAFAPNGIMMPPFQHPMTMGNGMYPFYAQPNVFNYPPQYGSYMQPLQPEQWRHFMAAAMAFGQNGGAGAGAGVAGGGGPGGGGGQPFGMQAGAFPTPTTPNGTSWTSHHCSCGDTCQCIGCAAHPYNEATQDYVRSAWNVMKEESRNGHGHDANMSGPHHNGSVGGTNTSNGEVDEATANPSSNGTTTPNQPHYDGAWSPSAAQSPSEAASGASEEQALSASDFFFVSYPFADSCAGETMSCPCGDDCQCIGCAIHNNPGRMSSIEDATKL